MLQTTPVEAHSPIADGINLLINGIPLSPMLILALYVLGVITALFSMIVASRIAGGIDFGTIQFILPRLLVLLALTTICQFFWLGTLIAGPVWIFGLMFFLQMDYRETRTLAKINWLVNCIWKVLLTMIFIK